MTFEATPRPTSSPASVVGATRSGLPDGPMTALHGPAVVRVNPSAQPGSGGESPTNGICGPSGSHSSASAVLQMFLASRLPAKTASRGSTLYALIWKERVTPLGRRICALRGSARRTFASDSGSLDNGVGWPTPCQQDGPKGGPSQGLDRLPGAANSVTWGGMGNSTDERCAEARREHCGRSAQWAGGTTPGRLAYTQGKRLCVDGAPRESYRRKTANGNDADGCGAICGTTSGNGAGGMGDSASQGLPIRPGETLRGSTSCGESERSSADTGTSGNDTGGMADASSERIRESGHRTHDGAPGIAETETRKRQWLRTDVRPDDRMGHAVESGLERHGGG